MATYIVIAIIAYLIGSVNFSVIISKKMAGFDLREKGSKNAGTTNALRTVGKKAAIITLLCDIAKGVIAVLIGVLISKIRTSEDAAIIVQVAGIFVVIGHTFPIFFGFKGGKGVATALGVILIMNYQIGLICLVFALLLIVLTRTVSIGSITAALLFPVLSLFIPENFIIKGNYLIFGVLLALFIVFNHRGNVKKILSGTENKLGTNKELK